MRILITGSRYWDEPWWPMKDWAYLLRLASARNETLTLVHGACPYGGIDGMVDIYAQLPSMPGVSLAIERHPADFKNGGRPAGPKRNQAMVDMGADACLGYPKGESSGTRGCLQMAWTAGIPILVTDWAKMPPAPLWVRLKGAGINL